MKKIIIIAILLSSVTAHAQSKCMVFNSTKESKAKYKQILIPQLVQQNQHIEVKIKGMTQYYQGHFYCMKFGEKYHCQGDDDSGRFIISNGKVKNPKINISYLNVGVPDEGTIWIEEQKLLGKLLGCP